MEVKYMEGIEKFVNNNFKVLSYMYDNRVKHNLVRITQTESKLKRENISTEKDANKAHYNVGRNIREVIEKNGGTMPEDLPTPEKSLKQLEKENKKMLKKQKYTIEVYKF